MRTGFRFTLNSLTWATVLVAACAAAHGQSSRSSDPRRQEQQASAAPQANSKQVTGSGTDGQITRWTGFGTVADSIITQDKNGNIGIGTTTPASKLDVAGIVEAQGMKFSDGTIQTTAAVSGLVSVVHDSTLTGGGTQGSPIGIASPLMVRDLDNPARQPFVATMLAANPNTSSFTVPPGKLFVIEYVSGEGTIPAGDQLFSVRLQVTTQGNTVLHRFQAILTGTQGNSNVYLMSHQTRLYADPASTVIISGLPAGVVFSATVSGYLVDVP